LKAFKLTNSINILLNEDMFNKYTMEQIIDELGEEDFFEYLEKTCTKIIRGLDERYATVKPKIVPRSIYKYHIKYPIGRKLSFEIRNYGQRKSLGVIFWHPTGSPSSEIKVNEPNFSLRLKEELGKLYAEWNF
jgi:hypothetical protein